MASVCAGTLCLMDAGVPIVRPVAGVAMGLIQEGGQVKILTDINGSEDHFGDMDLKIAGTEAGITGVQMDLKVCGVKEDMLMEAFTQARQARIKLIGRMLEAIAKPREEVSRLAPRLLIVKIPVDKIGAVIGPGGRVIKKMQEETGAQIDIADDGTVNVACKDAAGAERARDMIVGLTAEPEVGKTYLGKVSGIKEFGAFVEILPGRDGLVHISELSDSYVAKVEDVCKMGDEMLVKILSVDDQGKIRLSRKAVLKEKQGKGGEPPKEGEQGQGQGHDRGRDRNRDRERRTDRR
jgi:polyribonucleotide nucleotidyltransferase